MKYAILDTEGTGLFQYSLPADAEGQPRLASAAFLLAEEDATQPGLVITHECNFFIKPDGWVMGEEAGKINGLTTEFLAENGSPVSEVLAYYSSLTLDGRVLAAFNASHDTKHFRAELRRAGMPDLFETTPNICLMRACTQICKVPKKSGAGFKFPKLSEACAFFKIEQPAAHSALGDALSAFAIMQHLHKANRLPAPEVHFAKAKPEAAPTTA